MTFVLTLWIYGAGIVTHEYSSRETCERAAREVRSNVIGGMGYSCSQK
jgi:hypothetical protein